MSDKTKILSALHAFEPFDPGPKDHILKFRTVSARNHKPPAYVVAFLFLRVLNYRDFGRCDKVWWHTYFLFKGHVFLVRDYKFDSWSLEIKTDAALDETVLAEVLARIKAASLYADRILEKELRKRIAQGNFWINNGYRSLRAAFDFYVTEATSAEEARKRCEGTQRRRFSEGHHLDLILAYRVFPMMVSFFSLLEFLLDTFFAFERPDLGFSEFRRLSWRERFKQVIALPPRSDMLKAYERLVRIKDEFRNPLTHGLNNESGLLLSVPFGGLVPLSFEHFDNSIHFGLTPISPYAASEIMTACTSFLDLLYRTAPYAYYVRYLEYDFAVPMLLSRVTSIKSKMTNLEEFENQLKLDQEYQYAIINRDV